MRVHSMMSALVLVAGLSAAGCVSDATSDDPAASDDPATTDEATQSSQLATTNAGTPTGVRCSDKAWRVTFWSDASLTVAVGTMSCTCFGPELLDGQISNWSTLNFERDCDFQ